MTKQDIGEDKKAEEVYEQAQLEEEFDQLRRDNLFMEFFVRVPGYLCVLMTVWLIFPNIFADPFSLTIVIGLCLSAEASWQEKARKKLNRRIDIMYKLLKHKGEK